MDENTMQAVKSILNRLYAEACGSGGVGTVSYSTLEELASLVGVELQEPV